MSYDCVYSVSASVEGVGRGGLPHGCRGSRRARSRARKMRETYGIRSPSQTPEVLYHSNDCTIIIMFTCIAYTLNAKLLNLYSHVPQLTDKSYL